MNLLGVAVDRSSSTVRLDLDPVDPTCSTRRHRQGHALDACCGIAVAYVGFLGPLCRRI